MRSSLASCTAVILLGIAADSAAAQRERTRPTWNPSTTVTEAQASELTLTLTEASVRPIQIWVRAGGVIDQLRRRVTAFVPASEGARISVGQRVRAFSPETRSRMYQATVSQVVPQGGRVVITAMLMGRALESNRHYVLEIVTEAGEFLSVPNEAIIESDGKRVVYVQDAAGGYIQREIRTGTQGELFTHVLDGLKPGEQVVTFGSFFIDAEHKLKAP